MPADVEYFHRMNRIQRRSRSLSLVCALLVFTLPDALALYWWWADASTLAVAAGLAAQAIAQPLLAWQRVMGFAVTAVPVGMVMLALWQARQCFEEFARGELFTGWAVRGLQRFSLWVVASAGTGVLAQMACSALLTWGNAPGTRQLTLSLTADVLFTLLFAAMVGVMAAVIAQAQALAEDNAGFV